MSTLVFYLIIVFTAILVVMLLAYIWGDKIYYLLETILFATVIAVAYIYFGYLLVKEYLGDLFDFFRKRHLFIKGKIIKVYSKDYTIPAPTYITGENFPSLINTPLNTFNESVIDFQKDDGEILVLSLNEIKIKKNTLVINKEITAHCIKHFYDAELHLVDVYT